MTKTPRSLSIGALAKACDVPAPTIRYYEKIALLPKADRSRGDQRRYDQEDVDRLDFVRRCRAFGFSIKQVRSLLALPSGSAADCQTSRDIALARVDEIRTKVSDLLALENDLKALIDECDMVCDGQSDRMCSAFSQLQRASG